MTYRPQIAKRMANGDPITLQWLRTAKFHKVTKGPSAGTWLAWSGGKAGALPPDHPADCGAQWWDHEAFKTFESTIAYVESNGW